MAHKSKKSRGYFPKIVTLSLLALFIICCAFITSIFLFQNLSKNETSQARNTSLNEEQYGRTLTGVDAFVFKEWKQRIDAVGPQKAYEEFKKRYEKINSNYAHTYTHIFGSLLYFTMGLKGVSVCDAEFAYGCYHSFMAKAIDENGIGVIDTLNSHCINNLATMNSGTLGCQHGIGHGVLSYYGYTFHSLQHAIAVCHTLPESEQTKACEAGVYMEYDFRTMLIDEGVKREFVEADPDDPCNKLSSDLQHSCYYWHGQFLIDSLSGTIYDRFEKIGTICSAIKGKDNQYQCFAGAGNFIGQYIYWDVPTAAKACMLFREYGKDKSDACLSNAKAQYDFYGVSNTDLLN